MRHAACGSDAEYYSREFAEYRVGHRHQRRGSPRYRGLDASGSSCDRTRFSRRGRDSRRYAHAGNSCRRSRTPARSGCALGFCPASVSVKPGDTTTIAITVQNAQDLFSVPLLLQYDPAVLSVEDVRQGDFLSGERSPLRSCSVWTKSAGRPSSRLPACQILLV